MHLDRLNLLLRLEPVGEPSLVVLEVLAEREVQVVPLEGRVVVAERSPEQREEPVAEVAVEEQRKALKVLHWTQELPEEMLECPARA